MSQNEDVDTLSSRVTELQSKLTQLKREETVLDKHNSIMTENLKETRQDPSNQFYAYVTRDDFVSVFGDEDVVLTIRNFDKYDNCEDESNKDLELRVSSQWKKIDVRLVTNEGEAMRTEVAPREKDDHSEEDAKTKDLDGPISFSQGYEKKSNRHHIHRRKAVHFEHGEADMNDRLQTARVLLGYRPPKHHRKRNLDEASDSFESRYRTHTFSPPQKQRLTN